MSPDQHQGVIRPGDPDAGPGIQIGEQAESADDRGRENRPSVGFVVERDVARHDREVERPAGCGHALDAADELAHDFRAFGAAEIEVVGQRERAGADRAQIAPRLGDGLHSAQNRVGLAIARRAVGGERQRLGGAVNAHDCGIAARPADGIAHHHVVVLLPDPAPRAEVRAARQPFQRRDRGDPRGRAGRNRRLGGRDQVRPLVAWRGLDQRRHGDVGDRLAAVRNLQPARVGQPADDREIDAPPLEDRARGIFGARAQHHEHAFLAFGQHGLVGGHAVLAKPARNRGRARCRARPWTPFRRWPRSARPRPCPGRQGRHRLASAPGRPPAGASPRTDRPPVPSGVCPAHRRRTRPRPWSRRGCRRARSGSRHRPPRCRDRAPWRERSGPHRRCLPSSR